MIIPKEIIEKLKSLLSEKEYTHLMQYTFDIFQFQTELDDLIISRFDQNDESTKESDKLQRIYDEIYNLNEDVDDF